MSLHTPYRVDFSTIERKLFELLNECFSEIISGERTEEYFSISSNGGEIEYCLSVKMMEDAMFIGWYNSDTYIGFYEFGALVQLDENEQRATVVSIIGDRSKSELDFLGDEELLPAYYKDEWGSELYRNRRKIRQDFYTGEVYHALKKLDGNLIGLFE